MLRPKSTAHFMYADLALAKQADGSATAPEWIQLLPKGMPMLNSGKADFFWNGKTVPLVTPDGKTRTDKVPVDINHSYFQAADAPALAPAQGWIDKLEARDDGLYAHVEWTPLGSKAVADKAYRGISAEFFTDNETGEVVSVFGASLTNHPNVKGMTPLFNSATFQNPEEDSDMDKFLIALAAALGLTINTGEDGSEKVLASVTGLVKANKDATAHLASIAKAAGADDKADVTAVLAAVSNLRDPAKVVPVSVVDDLRKELQSVSAKLQSVTNDTARQKAEAFIDGAIAQGRVGVKPMRDHYIARHMATPADVEKEIGAMAILKPGEAHRAALPTDGDELSDAEKLTCKTMNISAEAFKKTKAKIAADRSAQAEL